MSNTRKTVEATGFPMIKIVKECTKKTKKKPLPISLPVSQKRAVVAPKKRFKKKPLTQ